MLLRGFAIALLALAPAGAAAAPKAPAPVRLAYTYADLADLALAAPVAAHVRIREAIPLKEGSAAAAGHSRYYVEADIVTLVRGPAGFPAGIRYLADVPNAADAAQKIRTKSDYLILAAPVRGRPGELQLAHKDAHIPWSPEMEARVRALLTEAAAPDAAPAIVGVGKAFHVAGSLPGESETQLFLPTADGRPISLNVLRRPGQQPRWAVALGEIVDEAAEPPKPDSLLWYRLACGLPATLPPESLADSDAGSADAIRADYALVLQGLGACARNRPRG